MTGLTWLRVNISAPGRTFQVMAERGGEFMPISSNNSPVGDLEITLLASLITLTAIPPDAIAYLWVAAGLSVERRQLVVRLDSPGTFDVELIARYLRLPVAPGEPPRRERLYELVLPAWHDRPGSKLAWYDFARATVELGYIWRERLAHPPETAQARR